MFSAKVINCFDSHLHWQATGEFAERLDLRKLTNPQEIKNLKIEPHHYRGDWLVGFGWDQNHWPEEKFPTSEILDQTFGDKPVVLSRIDGHAYWVSSNVIKRLQLDKIPKEIAGGRIFCDRQGNPNGIFVDTAMALIDDLMPLRTNHEIRRALIKGMQILNQEGFTHIRDLSCNLEQWEQATQLEDSGVLTLAVEEFFSLEEGDEFSTALKATLQAKRHRSQKLRVKGIKVFVDGALGSEGAWLSHGYASGSGHGLQLLSMPELAKVMKETWSQGLDLAVHVIGDEAAHQTVLLAEESLKSGPTGRLHLEHAELLRPETINLMKALPIVCHMQPCHWLSDHVWLKEKIGSLTQFAFPWRALEDAGIGFDFGSDSPIEPPSVSLNIEALRQSAEAGIPALSTDPLERVSHPERGWVPNCYTLFADGRPREVVFDGEHIL